jgi:hypothetical protein
MLKNFQEWLTFSVRYFSRVPPIAGVGLWSLVRAARILQVFLCPSSQCFCWQSLEQYETRLQPLHLLGPDADTSFKRHAQLNLLTTEIRGCCLKCLAQSASSRRAKLLRSMLRRCEDGEIVLRKGGVLEGWYVATFCLVGVLQVAMKVHFSTSLSKRACVCWNFTSATIAIYFDKDKKNSPVQQQHVYLSQFLWSIKIWQVEAVNIKERSERMCLISVFVTILITGPLVRHSIIAEYQ